MKDLPQVFIYAVFFFAGIGVASSVFYFVDKDDAGRVVRRTPPRRAEARNLNANREREGRRRTKPNFSRRVKPNESSSPTRSRENDQRSRRTSPRSGDPERDKRVKAAVEKKKRRIEAAKRAAESAR